MAEARSDAYSTAFIWSLMLELELLICHFVRDGGIYDRCTYGLVVFECTKFQFCCVVTLILCDAHFRDQREKKNAWNSRRENDSCAALFFVLEC